MIKSMSNAEFTMEMVENGCRLLVCTKPDIEVGKKAMAPVVSISAMEKYNNGVNDDSKIVEVADDKAANIERLLSIARGIAAENKKTADKTEMFAATTTRQSSTSASSSSSSWCSSSTATTTTTTMQQDFSAPLEKRVRKNR